MKNREKENENDTARLDPVNKWLIKSAIVAFGVGSWIKPTREPKKNNNKKNNNNKKSSHNRWIIGQHPLINEAISCMDRAGLTSAWLPLNLDGQNNENEPSWWCPSVQVWNLLCRQMPTEWRWITASVRTTKGAGYRLCNLIERPHHVILTYHMLHITT